MVSQNSSQCPGVALLFLVYEGLPYPAPVKVTEFGISGRWWWRNILTSVDSPSQLVETFGVFYAWFIVYKLVVDFL